MHTNIEKWKEIIAHGNYTETTSQQYLNESSKIESASKSMKKMKNNNLPRWKFRQISLIVLELWHCQMLTIPNKTNPFFDFAKINCSWKFNFSFTSLSTLWLKLAKTNNRWKSQVFLVQKSVFSTKNPAFWT